MAVLAGPVGGVGIGHQDQMLDRPAQPRRIHPPGRLDQDRFGLQLHMVSQLTGAAGDRLGMRGRDLPGTQGGGGLRQRTTEQRPGGPHAAVGGIDTQPAAGAQPRGGRGSVLALVGPGGAAGVDGGEPPQPLAFEAVQQAPHPQQVLSQGGISQPVQILGGQRVHGRHQPGQAVRRSRRSRPRLVGRMCVRVHDRNLIKLRSQSKHRTRNVDNYSSWKLCGTTPAPNHSPSLIETNHGAGACMGP